MNRFVLWILLFVLTLLLALWGLWPGQQSQPEQVVVPRAEQVPREVLLYFTDPKGLYLISEEQQIAGCNDERQCIAQTVEALAAGSSQLQAVIPERTPVLGVEIEGALVRINFGRELVDLHPGGSMSELLTVYGLTNTLAVNFPYLRQLQILIDGQVVPTLKGHVDISRPIKAEFSYSYAPDPGANDEPLPESEPSESTSGPRR